MQQNELFDVIIIGASEEGIALGESLKSKAPNLKLAIVSKHFNYIKQLEKLKDTLLITNEAVYSSFNHGLVILTLKDRKIVVGKNIVVATGGKPIKSIVLKNNNICYKPNDLKNISKHKPAVVYGATQDAVKYALAISKKFKYVYLCSKSFNLTCDEKLLKKLNDTANIVHLPNCTIVACKNDKEGNLCEITLDTYDSIKCSALILALGRLPDVSGIDLKMVELDKDNYVKTNSLHQTTIVPNIYAIGECTKHNTKRSITTVCNHILGR